MSTAVEVGDDLWVFLSNGPMTQLNAAVTGIMLSPPCSMSEADHLMPFVANPKRSGIQSLHSTQAASEYAMEYTCELVRRKVAPASPSRFGCLFFFPSEHEASKAASRHGWTSKLWRVRVEEMRSSHLADMETVSAARLWVATQSTMSEATTDAIWGRYWNGEPGLTLEIPTWIPGGNPPIQQEANAPPSPIWEVLLDGRVSLIT